MELLRTLESTKTRTEKLYTFHLIGMNATYKYDVRRQTVQLFINRLNKEVFIREYIVDMDFNEFIVYCKEDFLRYVKFTYGDN